MEPVWERDVEFHAEWDLCLCGSGGGGGIDGSYGDGVLDGSGESSVGDSRRSILRVLCIGVVEVVGVLCIEAVEMDCTGVVDIMVLGWVFMVEVVQGVELVVGCVVRLVLLCVNGRG